MTTNAHQVNGERQAQQEDEDVEVEGVGEDAVAGVVEPAPRERCPHPLAEDVQGLGPHLLDAVSGPLEISKD